MSKADLLVEALLNSGGTPNKFLSLDPVPIPDELPDNAGNIDLSPEDTAFLDTLDYMEVNGEDFAKTRASKVTEFCILSDYTTDLRWLYRATGEGACVLTSINPYQRD